MKHRITASQLAAADMRMSNAEHLTHEQLAATYHAAYVGAVRRGQFITAGVLKHRLDMLEAQHAKEHA